MKAQTKGLKQAAAGVQRIGAGMAGVAAKVINDQAYAARKDVQAEMTRVFDRPTPFVQRSLWVDMASPVKLSARLWPRSLGGKGADPARVLAPHVFGGDRSAKRSERSLRRVGLLQPGFWTAIGKGAPADKIDRFGNLKGAFVAQLLSYFRAQGEQGYRANMTDKRRKALGQKRRGDAGFLRINGVEYFATQGRLRGGSGAHLQPGIYSRKGIHGSDIAPVLVFVRKPTYRKRLAFEALSRQAAERVGPVAFERRMGALSKVAG
jgi:hypothetical protein